MSGDILKSLTEAHPACRVAVFADLTLPMVLVSGGRDSLHREALQTLCVRARDVLTTVDGEEHDPATACDTAIASGKDEVAVFLRVPDAPNDALCCVCDLDADLDVFLVDARDCLSRLAGTAA